MLKSILPLVLLAGCSIIPGTEAHKIAEAEGKVRYMLRDADSAQFRNLRLSRGSVCGEVNSKNSFGAYAGYTLFSVEGEEVAIMPDRIPTNDDQTPEERAASKAAAAVVVNCSTEPLPV